MAFDSSLNLQISDIARRQNSLEMLRLLKSRQWRWEIARRWQQTQICLLLVVPFILVIIGQFTPEFKPIISVIAALLTLIDIVWIDRHYRSSIKTAARMSEFFDMKLLRMEWDTLTSGHQPTPEEIDRAARRWDENHMNQPLEDWYAKEVDEAPLSLARIICQRTNLTYDRDLRKNYSFFLTLVAIVASIVIIIVGIFSTYTVAEFAINLLVPTSPFLFWTLRERGRQIDAIDANGPPIAEAEKLIGDIINVGCEDAFCEQQSRRLQNAIFTRRATTYLLFPGVYNRNRSDSEEAMRSAARHWLELAGFPG